MNGEQQDLKMLIKVAEQNSKVTNAQCFSHCRWLEEGIRCRNCPHIQIQGGNVDVINPNIKGDINILELAEKTTLTEWSADP